MKAAWRVPPPQHVSCLSHDADRTLEREANVFAAELLMPEGAVRDPDAAPERFGVSEIAFQWRLFSFDLGPRPGA